MNASMHIFHMLLLSLFFVLMSGAASPAIFINEVSTIEIAATEMPIIETEALDGTFHWKRIPIPAADTAEMHALTAFEHFFRYGSYGIPHNVKVLNVSLANGLLTVDVSADILSYGGSAFERALAEQLIKIAAEIPSAEKFTLTTDGVLRPLIYGTEINRIQL